MGKMVDLDDLVSVGVIAARLGLTHITRVHDLARRSPTFPRPVKMVSRTGLWLWSDIEPWALENRWERYPAEGRRVLVGPDDLVTADIITTRLRLEPEADDFPNPVGNLFRFGDAEDAWVTRINGS